MVQTGYSVVAAGVVTLRWKDKTASPASSSTWREGLICIMVVACSGFGAGLFYRFGSLWVSMVAAVFALLASIALHLRHVSLVSLQLFYLFIYLFIFHICSQEYSVFL